HEVVLTVSTPAMPVTVRLQLLAVSPPAQQFTLTLPPIALKPDPRFEGNYLGEAFQVRHVGYSRQVKDHFKELEEGRYQFTRRGTARFGSWPDGINRFE